MRVRTLMLWAASVALGLGAIPASAQITTIDPNTAIDSDLQTPPPVQNDPQPIDQGAYQEVPRDQSVVDPQPVPAPVQPDAGASARAQAANTYQRDDLI